MRIIKDISISRNTNRDVFFVFSNLTKIKRKEVRMWEEKRLSHHRLIISKSMQCRDLLLKNRFARNTICQVYSAEKWQELRMRFLK